MNTIMFAVGLILVMLAGSVSDSASNWWIVLLGGAAIVMLFFSIDENRNPKRVKRLWLLVKKGHLPW